MAGPDGRVMQNYYGVAEILRSLRAQVTRRILRRALTPVGATTREAQEVENTHL